MAEIERHVIVGQRHGKTQAMVNEAIAAELEGMAEKLEQFQDPAEWGDYDQGLLKAQTVLRERADELVDTPETPGTEETAS